MAEKPATAAEGLARLAEDMWYGSSLFGIIPSETPVAEQVKYVFGWKTPLPPSMVAQQLVAIAESFHTYAATVTAVGGAATQSQKAKDEKKEKEGKEDGKMENDAVQVMQQAVSSVIPVIYQKLSLTLQNPTGAEEQSVRQHLHGAPWVFVGDRFVETEQVAFASQVNATPYLYTVPPDLACFAPLLKTLGVRASFGPSDFVQVLHNMAMETGAKGSSSSSKTAAGHKKGWAAAAGTGSGTLTLFQLELAIALVQRLSDEVMQVSDWELFAPDEQGKLARASELVYDDAPWLSKKTQRRSDVRFAHPKISSVTGEKLGIRSVRRLLMESHADTMDFGLPAGEAEAFGQSEALTRRLRHILELYPERAEISELLQNADDAGASTVRILYRDFPRDSFSASAADGRAGEGVRD
eukprot:evm.model.NODE_4411_length_24991_cov_22.225641.5